MRWMAAVGSLLLAGFLVWGLRASSGVQTQMNLGAAARVPGMVELFTSEG